MDVYIYKYFDQINAALVSMRGFLKSYQPQTFKPSCINIYLWL